MRVLLFHVRLLVVVGVLHLYPRGRRAARFAPLAVRTHPLVRLRHFVQVQALEMVRTVAAAVAENQIAAISANRANLLLALNRCRSENDRQYILVHHRLHLLHVD